MAEDFDDDKTRIAGTAVGRAGDSALHQNALRPGTRMAEFEIVGLIGEGGFGIVYRALDHSLHRTVALKEFMPSALASRGADASVSVRSERQRETFLVGLRSFINEARMLAQFDHPALVKVYRFWEANGTAYMAMPLLEGRNLLDVLRELPARPDEAWIRKVLSPVVDALALIHKSQVYHRDIAPDNIMLLPGERAVLLDFGAARRVISDRTQALTVILKPGYAPIEQYAETPGMKQGPWTDVYGLAAVMYFIIVGRKPPSAVARALQDTYAPLATSEAAGHYSQRLLQGIDRCLRVRPEDRPPSMDAMRDLIGFGTDDLAVAVASAAVQAVPTSPAAQAASTVIPTTTAPPTPAAPQPVMPAATYAVTPAPAAPNAPSDAPAASRSTSGPAIAAPTPQAPPKEAVSEVVAFVAGDVPYAAPGPATDESIPAEPVDDDLTLVGLRPRALAPLVTAAKADSPQALPETVPGAMRNALPSRQRATSAGAQAESSWRPVALVIGGSLAVVALGVYWLWSLWSTIPGPSAREVRGEPAAGSETVVAAAPAASTAVSISASAAASVPVAMFVPTRPPPFMSRPFTQLGEALDAAGAASERKLAFKLDVWPKFKLGWEFKVAGASQSAGHLYAFLWDQSVDKVYRLRPNDKEPETEQKAGAPFQAPQRRHSGAGLPVRGSLGKVRIVVLLSKNPRTLANTGFQRDGAIAVIDRAVLEAQIATNGLAALVGTAVCSGVAECSDEFALKSVMVEKVAADSSEVSASGADSGRQPKSDQEEPQKK